MNKLNKWVKAVLASTSTAAALSTVAAATAFGFELRSELNLTSGYRNDNAKFAICSTLSDPDFFGFGQANFRNINMWEVQLNGWGAFTDSVYLRGMVGYAKVLGGKVYDSGVVDILSDPYNATLGEDYYRCCVGCICEDACPCECTCGNSSVFHNTVPVQASLGGSAWDAKIALGYMFHASEEFGIAPVIGWEFNQQRYSYNHAIWGPIPLNYQAVGGCSQSTDEAYDFYVDHEVLYNGVGIGDEIVIRDGYSDSLGSFAQSLTLQDYADPSTNGACGPVCVAFGLCGDDTVYRARWNGPFIGLDFYWTPSMDWKVTFTYELQYNHYSGRFDSLGGGGCCETFCGCNDCPRFQNFCDTSDCVEFQPQTITTSSNGWGQVFNLYANYAMNQNWQVGFELGYKMRNANDCGNVDPCESCVPVCNGAALVEDQTINDGFPSSYPIWANASFKKARWRMFDAQVSLGYLF